MQACFLGDVGVIGCNSLGDSHFQMFAIDDVEILIDYYLHITVYVSHVLTSCTHITSNSLLNLVHKIVCEFCLAIQDYIFYDFDTKYIHWLKFWGKKCKNIFLKFWVENKCF